MYMLLDSGAFSAWNTGKPIDLDEYIEYILLNREHVDAYINLDVIPGNPGKTPTPAEVELSAEESWKNFEYMESSCLSPLPVFHQGERFYWLKKMVDHGCKYICISPANDRSTEQKIQWLDKVFDYLCDEHGDCPVHTHALGVTSADIMFRYPWHSVDSTTWLAAGSRFGLLRCPRVDKDGNWDLTKNLATLRISKEAPKVEGHYDFLPDADKAVVLRFIKEAGLTFEGVRDDLYDRAVANAVAFKMLSDANITVRYKNQHQSLFENF